MKNNFFLLILSLVFGLNLKAQNKSEFFVSVNPVTGTFHMIQQIPTIKLIPEGIWKYTTYDCKDRRFFFKGLDSFYHSYLVTIDATSGNVLYNPPHPNTGDTLDDIFYLHYDTATSKLYGIYKDASLFPPFVFASIDPISGNVTPINNLTGVNFIVGSDQNTALDSHNGRYFLFGVDSSGVNLFTIDVNTGTIINSAPMGGNYREFQFDVITNKLYGILLSGTMPYMQHSLVSIDINTGVYTLIAAIPGVVNTAASGKRFSTFDSNHGRYIFCGGDSTGNWSLYSIDVNNGNTIYSPPYPLPPITPTMDNVIELQYDNSCDSIYALHWGDVETTFVNENINDFEISIYPNPFTEDFQLSITSAETDAEVSIYNIICQQQVHLTISHSKSIHQILSLRNYSAGVYLVSITVNGQRFMRKVVKE
ncbi:hypothetical protein LBMAG27_25280 [Bacteroidota bacterium]|nr:hypothetical protein LBMAG27_25280 [Bacteroidota bacterium]